MSHPEILRQLLKYASSADLSSPDCWKKEYRLPLECTAFQGHFPDYPVLPAIVQIAMVRLLIEEATGNSCTLDIQNAKFSKTILPDSVVNVVVRRTNLQWKAKVLVQQADSETFEAASLTFTPVKPSPDGAIHAF